MKNILFICSDNGSVSQIAQAYAIRHGKNIVRAYSAGVKVAHQISPWAVDVMKKAGYDISIHQPQHINHFLDLKFEYAITMGCPNTCLYVVTRVREDWDIRVPIYIKEAEAFDLCISIEQRVKTLIQKMELTFGF